MKVRAGQPIEHQRTDLPPRRCQSCGAIKDAHAFSQDKRWLRRVCKACRAGKERDKYHYDETTRDARLNDWFSGKWRRRTEEA